MRLRRAVGKAWMVQGAAVLLLLAASVAGAQADPAVRTPPAPTGTATPQTSATAPAAASAATTPATPQGGTIRGSVVAGTPGKPGSIALPGVAITATNTLTGRKYTTATDIDGAYTMAIPRNGRYVVKAELAGFAATTQEVVITGVDTSQAAAAGISIVAKPTDFGLQLASRAAAAEAVATNAGAAAPLRRGVQSLNLNAGGGLDTEDASAAGEGNSGVSVPSLAGVGDTAAAGDSPIVVNGQQGTTNNLANISEDDIRQRIQDGVAQAQASGMLPQGMDPTNMIVGMLGNMMSFGGGGPGGPGGGGPGGGGGGRGGRGGGGGGGGNFRNFNPTQLHGGVNYSGDFSGLDSAPWSITLLPQRNSPYARDTLGASLAGSPFIPGLIKPSTKQFVFLNVNLTRNTSPVVYNETVPTDAERNGDFSGLTQTVNGQAALTPIYDPVTGQQFNFGGTPNVIDPARISAQARAALAYYPHANVPNAGPQDYNYNANTVTGTNSANISARYQRSLGKAATGPFGFGGGGGGVGRAGRGGGNRTNNNAPPVLRQSINSSFSFSHSASDQREPILVLGGAGLSDGYNLSAGYTVGYGRLSNSATLTWNRSHAQTRNYFTDTTTNPSTQASISVPSQGAVAFRPNFYNGLPTLAITNFLSLVNVNPSETIGQTLSFSDFVSWRHGKHNYRFGVDFRRVRQDSLGGTNPLGTFQFSGFNTQSLCDKAAATGTTLPNCPASSGTKQATSGAGFADFLLGLPQQTTIQAALNKVYLRENVIDWYAQDDYRVRNGLTLNLGLRWEYFGPFYEKNNRLINLTGISTQTTSVGCVTPNALSLSTPSGTLNCTGGDTRSLIHPDHTMYSPRIAVAWRPSTKSKLLKETVFRAGYAISYNTGQFATFARLLAYQPPYAVTQNNLLSTQNNTTGCTNTTLTLASGFNCSGKLFQNSFAVNPNYRLGLVHVYNADIQRTLPWGILLNFGYNGSKGSDLDVTRAPNHTATSVTTPNAVAFRYEDSIAASHFNALTVNARKRMQAGVSLQGTYQYAHSIDDASSFGGSSNASSIQNDARPDLERSNSSFDVRHRLTGTWVYELPVGPNRRFLNKGGFMAAALDGFSLSGNFTFASGRYFTPSYQSTAAQIAAGGNYTLRPDRIFSQPLQGAGKLRNYFNKNAFTFPASPDGYGTASRYSIEGPGQVLVSASLSRTVKLGDTRSFEGRIQASNVFNTVQYSGINTVLSSATFGQVTGAAAMRQIQFTGRYRF